MAARNKTEKKDTVKNLKTKSINTSKKSVSKNTVNKKGNNSKKEVVQKEVKTTTKDINNKIDNADIKSIVDNSKLTNNKPKKNTKVKANSIKVDNKNTKKTEVKKMDTKKKNQNKRPPKFSTIQSVKVETNNKKTTSKIKNKSFISKINDIFKFKTKKKKNLSKKNSKNNVNKKKKNSKKKSNKESKLLLLLNNKKTKKWLIVVAVICVLILLVEGIYVIKFKVDQDKNTIYYDSLNSVCIDDTDIIVAGSSNFKYSKHNEYTNGLEKGKLVKYNKNGKIVFEKMYENGINTTFSSVISVSDGYIVVGSGEFSEEEKNSGAREAFIIKYDKNGNIVWEKFYHVLTNTRFNKVIETNDGYIAVGQSIYANMEMGNHTTGGGIIVKYDKDGNKVWNNNHGGTKSGNFNDVVYVNNSFYVVGKDAVDSGNLVKFDKNGKYVWHKNYSYTDGLGFTGIAYSDDSLYVVGSKKVLPADITEEDDRTTKNTDALLVQYDLDGKVKLQKTFGGSNYERYNSIVAYHNNLYVIGHIASKDAGLKVQTNGELMTGLVIRYDIAGNMLKKEVLGGSNNDNLTDIVTDGASLYISGYSNSKDGNMVTSKNNGKDYFGKFIKLNLKFKTLLLK